MRILLGICSFLALSVHAADPVVVWSRDLRTMAAVNPASAIVLEDQSLLVSLDAEGFRRIWPGGRVEVLSEYSSPLETDAEGRVFRIGSLTRIDPATSLAFWGEEGRRLAIDDPDAVYGLSQGPRCPGRCVVRLDPRDGRVVWEIPREPGTHDVEAATGSGGVGIVAWRALPTDGPRRQVSLVGLDLATGERVWGRVLEAPSGQNVVLSSGRNGPLYLLAPGFGQPDVLLQIDPRTGEELWRRVLPQPPESLWSTIQQVLVDGHGAAYVCRGNSSSTRITKFDSEGRLVFQVILGRLAAPVARGTDGRLVAAVLGADGLVLERRDILSGRILTRSPLGPPTERLLALGTAPEGSVTVHTWDASTRRVIARRVSKEGAVVAEERADLGEARGGYWPTGPRIERVRGGYLLSGTALLGIDGEDGALKYTVPPESPTAWRARPWQGTPEGDVVLPRRDGSSWVLEKRDGASGAVLWTSTPGAIGVESDAWVVGTTGDVSVLRGRGNRLTFERFQGSDGVSAVRTEIIIPADSQEPALLWAAEGGLVVRSRNLVAFVDEESGRIRWIRQSPGVETVLVPGPPSGDLLFQWNVGLTKVSASSGETIWETRPPSGYFVTLPDGDVLVLGQSTLSRLSRSNGAVLAAEEVEVGEYCRSWTASLSGDGRLWAMCESLRTVAVFDSVTCRKLGARKIASPALSSPSGIVAGPEDAYVSSPPYALRVSLGPGISPIVVPSYTCGDDVDLALPFSGVTGSRVQIAEGFLPRGLTLQEFTGRISGRLEADGVHGFGVRVLGTDGTASVTTMFTMRVRPLETNPLELEATPPHVKAGEPVRLSARGARLAEAVVWLPGGERAREILVRPETSTLYVAVDSMPGACPRRGSIWVDVTERPPQAPGAGFFTVAPCRLLDTRDTAEPLAAGDLRLVEVGSRCGIPLGASALSVNLTAVDAARFGTLVAVDAEDAEARGTGVPFTAGRTRSLGLTAPVSQDGFLALRADLPSGGSVHAIVDVSGYFQ